MKRFQQYMKQNKYHAHRVTVNGEQFDSQAEAERYAELKLLERVGKISELKRQVQYQLIPAMQLDEPRRYKDGHTRYMESAVIYKADFVYKDENGKTVVEDVKGFVTDTYVLKRKLMKYIYGIEVREVSMT